MADKKLDGSAAPPAGAASFDGAAERAKRDWLLKACIAGVVVLAIVLIIPFASMVRMSLRHNAYMADLSTSFAQGERRNSILASMDGGETIVSKSQATRLFTTIADAGMGKPSERVPSDSEEGVVLSFGDGTTLGIWPENDHDPEAGVLLRYTRADGDVFAYSTSVERLVFDDVLAMLGLS